MNRELRALLILAVLLLVAGIGYQQFFGVARSVAPVLVDVSGDVRREHAGRSEAATAGTTLEASDRIRAGADGRATLALGPSSRVTVDNSSSVRVTGVDREGVNLELEDGRVHATVRPDGPRLVVTADGRQVTADDADFTAVRTQDGTFAVQSDRGRLGVTGVPGVSNIESGGRMVHPNGGDPLQAPANTDLLLAVAWPDEKRTRKDSVTVQGTTEPGATVTLGRGDRQTTVVADAKGHFSATVALAEGDNTIDAKAVGVLGNAATVQTTLVRDTQAPTIGVTLH